MEGKLGADIEFIF